MRFLRMVSALTNRAYVVHVISTAENPLQHPNLRWHRIGAKFPSPLKDMLYFLTFLPYSLYVIIFLDAKDIIAFGPIYAFLFLPASFCAKCRIYCMVRGMLSDEYTYQGRNHLLRSIVAIAERVGLSFSDRIIVVSQTLAERIVRRYGVQEEKIVHLPNEIPKVPAEEVDSEFGFRIWKECFPEEGLRIFTAGVITPIKNYEMLIEAVSLLKIPCHICIAGKPAFDVDKRYFNKLRSFVRNYGLEKHITWLGWVSRAKVLGVLKASDLFISTSHHEGMSNIVLEALALRVPCLSKNTPEALELLKEKTLTFETAQELAETIERFYSKKAFSQTVIEASNQARERWSFDWEAKLIQTLEG